jgi:drug/metabolite transporter (DMT)-like permease
MTELADEAGERQAAGPVRRAVTAAILFMLLSALMSSLLHVGVRIIGARLPIIEIVFLRTTLTMALTLPLVVRPGQSAWRTSAPGLQLLRGAVGVCSMFLWYYALSSMPLGDAATLGQTTAIWVVIGAAAWFGEAVGAARWLAVLAGMAGAVIVLKPGAGIVGAPALAAIASSALWALSLLMAKGLARHDSSLTIAFYQPLTIAPLAAVAAIPFWVQPAAMEWLLLLGLAVTAGIGNYCTVHALRLADASITMPVDYTKLLWTTAWGYLLFQEFPELSTWAGAALILAASLFIAVREGGRAASRKSGAR